MTPTAIAIAEPAGSLASSSNDSKFGQSNETIETIALSIDIIMWALVVALSAYVSFGGRDLTAYNLAPFYLTCALAMVALPDVVQSLRESDEESDDKVTVISKIVRNSGPMWMNVFLLCVALTETHSEGIPCTSYSSWILAVASIFIVLNFGMDIGRAIFTPGIVIWASLYCFHVMLLPLYLFLFVINSTEFLAEICILYACSVIIFLALRHAEQPLLPMFFVGSVQLLIMFVTGQLMAADGPVNLDAEDTLCHPVRYHTLKMFLWTWFGIATIISNLIAASFVCVACAEALELDA